MKRTHSRGAHDLHDPTLLSIDLTQKKRAKQPLLTVGAFVAVFVGATILIGVL